MYEENCWAAALAVRFGTAETRRGCMGGIFGCHDSAPCRGFRRLLPSIGSIRRPSFYSDGKSAHTSVVCCSNWFVQVVCRRRRKVGQACELHIFTCHLRGRQRAAETPSLKSEWPQTLKSSSDHLAIAMDSASCPRPQL